MKQIIMCFFFYSRRKIVKLWNFFYDCYKNYKIYFLIKIIMDFSITLLLSF